MWQLISWAPSMHPKTHVNCSFINVQTLSKSFQSGWQKAATSITIFRHLSKQHSFQKPQVLSNACWQELKTVVQVSALSEKGVIHLFKYLNATLSSLPRRRDWEYVHWKEAKHGSSRSPVCRSEGWGKKKIPGKNPPCNTLIACLYYYVAGKVTIPEESDFLAKQAEFAELLQSPVSNRFYLTARNKKKTTS